MPPSHGNPYKLERKLATDETTVTMDGGWALLRPLTGVVVSSSLRNHAAMRLPPRKPRAPEIQERRKQGFKIEDLKIVLMALGNMPLKQNFSLENDSFQTILKIIFQIFYLIR